MLDPADLRPRRQQVLQVAFPPRRVLAAPVPERRCPIEDTFNTASYPARGVRFAFPNRLDRLGDERCVDAGNRQIAHYRKRVGAERRAPLCRVLWVSPA